jgi:hypothetical protein
MIRLFRSELHLLRLLRFEYYDLEEEYIDRQVQVNGIYLRYS